MKLIVADMDGTLIHRQYISDKTKDTIKKLQDRGYLFTIATGRHMHATKTIVEALNITCPVICGNGAFIYDFQNNTVLHQQVIDNQIVIKTMAQLDAYHLDYLLYTTQDIVATQRSKDKLVSKIGPFEATVVDHRLLKSQVNDNVIKILVVEENQSLINQMKSYLVNQSDLYYLQSQPYFLDIGHIKSNKGNALDILMSHLGVEAKDTMAIGDQENDITMIKHAGLGVAMGDGHEALKRAADVITKPFFEEGFSYAVETWVFHS